MRTGHAAPHLRQGLGPSGGVAQVVVKSVKSETGYGSEVAAQRRAPRAKAGPPEAGAGGTGALLGPTGGKLRYPARSSNALSQLALDARIKHRKFFPLCPEPALFAFI